MKYCACCGLPETYPGIHFNEQEICNFCHFYKENRNFLENTDLLEELFASRLEAAKEKAKANGSKYDCLVGISGGKDSAYVVYQLKHKYNMRILTFSYDNCFSTDYGKKNIETIVKKLDVDHVTFSLKDSQVKKYYKMCTKMFHNFCMVCFHLIHYTSHLIAGEKKIPLIVNGRTKGQVLQSADSTKLLEPFERSHNLKEFEYQMFGDKVEKAAKNKRNDYLEDYDIESLSYFMYHPYNEDEICSFLQKKIAWQRADAGIPHADCWAHAIAEKFNLDSKGYPVMTGELAVMVRQGELTIEEAAKRREEDTQRYQNLDREILEQFNQTIGV